MLQVQNQVDGETTVEIIDLIYKNILVRKDYFLFRWIKIVLKT